MITVHLKNITLYGKHGVYEKEHLFDAPFSITISCTLNTKQPVTTLEETLNYEAVFVLVKNIFSIPFALLETLAATIAVKIKENYAIVSKVKITIYKVDPPIASIQGQVGITYED